MLLILVLACGGGDDTDGGGDGDDRAEEWDRFVTALEAAVCPRIDECGPLDDLSTPDECVDYYEEEYRGHPCNTFQADAGQDCVDAIAAATCDELTQGIEECEDYCPDTAPPS